MIAIIGKKLIDVLIGVAIGTVLDAVVDKLKK